jgi:hypothetical protein
MNRTDIHRPSVIIPADYEYVAPEHVQIFGVGDCLYAEEMRRRIRLHMERTGGTYSRHQHGGNCHVCGSINAIWTILYYHRPSNTYVRTGQDCASKIDNGEHAGEINAFTRHVTVYLEAQAGKRKARAILTDAGFPQAWDVYLSSEPIQYEENTIRDIVGKLVRYGSASDKALGYVGILLGKIKAREQVAAQRAQEAAAAINCPTGRVKVTGTVLTIKAQDGVWGTVVKMLVKAEDGFKVWVTVPTSAQVNRGQPITFTATITPSKDDPKFGFGKRPHIPVQSLDQPQPGA